MNRKSNVPIFITALFSVLLIFASWWYVHRDDRVAEKEAETPTTVSPLDAVRPLQESDHILGNPNAEIVLYVYSDFACPYCKDYHAVLRTLLSGYGRDGRVALVYRHLPFVQLHPEAPMYAHASKCVAEEAGDVGFWKFADALFEKMVPKTPPLTAAQVVLLAEEVGVSRQSFVACMRSNKYMEAIEMEYNEALEAGGRATPFTIVEVQGKRTTLLGAQPYRLMADSLQRALDALPPRETSQQQSSPFELSPTYQGEFDALGESEVGEATTTQVTSSTATTTATSSILDGIVPR